MKYTGVRQNDCNVQGYLMGARMAQWRGANGGDAEAGSRRRVANRAARNLILIKLPEPPQTLKQLAALPSSIAQLCAAALL